MINCILLREAESFVSDTVKKPKQAEDSSIAELGSLAMEFTRLAQITGNHSYFDAIQRITNALEEIQMKTSLPGMWPTKLDASGGCKPPPGPIKATGVATEKLRRQIDDGVPENPKPCVPGGIVTRPYGTDQYTLGAMSDSFYEYLIKMHILLGGSTEQYARMHKAALKQIRRLFYRPMAKDDPDILFSGDLEVHGTNKDETFKADSGHLVSVPSL